MNLHHIGIDFRVPTTRATPDQSTIIEVNSSPLLVQLHKLGFEEEAIAGQVRVLKAILARTA